MYKAMAQILQIFIGNDVMIHMSKIFSGKDLKKQPPYSSIIISMTQFSYVSTSKV